MTYVLYMSKLKFISQFDINSTTTFTVEILGYRPVSGSSSSNMFFDVDHIRLSGECCSTQNRLALETPADFALYPNPAENYVNIELENYKDRDVTIQLVDQVGRLVKEMDLPQLSDTKVRMELDDISNGSYFVFVRSKEGHRFTRKLMVIKTY